MSFYCNNNNSSLTVPITTRSVSNHASFYASLSINERFERLGSGQEMDLFGKSVSRTSIKSQMSKSLFSSIFVVIFCEYGQLVITMTCFGTVSIVLFTFQKKYRFRGPMPIFCCVATICISSMGLRDVYKLNPVQILGPVAISSLISMYFVLEMYYAMGFMTVDDYILAYISFHIDLAYPINCLHHVCEISENVDDFTEYFNPDPHGSHG
ncbi:hypothetical protein EDC94DRAFT_513360 [Helicostylum pulchrum]|nr:hypothetical protein EDC94DRAFT_513360 [Helicostylum pulchrum]